jgi:hypothetical protein
MFCPHREVSTPAFCAESSEAESVNTRNVMQTFAMIKVNVDSSSLSTLKPSLFNYAVQVKSGFLLT